MERILVVYYSQSGQLKQIVDHFVTPFVGAGISVDYYEIEMETPFPFPWNNEAFFGAFPESFLQIPQPIKPLPAAIMEQQYSLVVLAYQVWYLSPSIPITSFLKSEQAAHLLSGKPVVTLSGTRNMWIKAQEKIGQMLQKYNATIVANIALTDRHHNHISVLTIVHWLFTGEKDRYLGIFPLPGVSDRDIASATQYGEIVLKHKQIAEQALPVINLLYSLTSSFTCKFYSVDGISLFCLFTLLLPLMASFDSNFCTLLFHPLSVELCKPK